MKRRAIACLLVIGMFAAGCGAKNADDQAAKDASTNQDDGGSSGDTPSGSDAGKFGTLDSPCGKADKVATVKADQAGLGTDKLYIGVGNDRDSIRPGLLKELWDGANGFVNWCNEQGGINGLQLEAVDLDGKVVEVDKAMAKACTDVFAMVGGGYAQDDFIFTGKEGADFHKCKMIAVPGFAVSTAFSEASDQVQVLPNPAYVKPTGNLAALAKLYPDNVKNYGVVYGTLPSIEQNKDQIVGVAESIDAFGKPVEIGYDIFSQDWALIAQQVVDKKLEAVSFVGEPPNLSKFSQALNDQGYDGVITADANQYDSRLIAASGPDAVEGVIVRIATHSFEEADKWPAMKQFLEIMDKSDPKWERAGLAVQAFSSSLMFAVAAKACADEGEITRECVLTEAQGIHEFDAGGLITSGDPGKNMPSECAMLVQVKNGSFERLYPEIDSDDDDGDGFACSDLVTLEGDFGEGNTSSSILG